MNALRSLARKARLSLGLAIIKGVKDDAGVQRLQISLLEGEVRDDVTRVQEYGLSSFPKLGAPIVVAAVGGNRNHLVALSVTDPRFRKASLEEGEVALYHWEGDYILFKNGREIEIVSNTKVTVTAPEVVVTASTKVRLDTPLVEMTGDLKVAGDVTADGTVKGGSVKTVGGKDLDTLRVTAVQPGGGVSGPPQ